jgi:hypothetical protein
LTTLELKRKVNSEPLLAGPETRTRDESDDPWAGDVEELLFDDYRPERFIRVGRAFLLTTLACLLFWGAAAYAIFGLAV